MYKYLIIEQEEYTNDYSCRVLEYEEPITLDAMWELVDEFVDMPIRSVNGKDFMFIVSDVGLLKTLPIALYWNDTKDFLVGNIIIAKLDNRTGDTLALTDDDIGYLKKNIKAMEYINALNERGRAYVTQTK